MRAWEIQGGFGLDKLTLVERPDPQPGPGQVLIRVRAVSLNFRDLLTVDGKYNPKQKLPLIPCSDGAGEVVAVGDGVTRAKPGDRVCGIFALQFARALGLHPILTSSSDEQLERARELGASGLINYRQVTDWGAKAREMAGGAGVDLVVEVGGAGTLDQSLKAVRMGGTVCLIGNLAGIVAQIPLTAVFMQQVRLQGILVGHREGFEAMNRAIALHGLRPVVDRVFPFEEARGAFELMGAAGHFGKVCIRV